MNIKEYLDILKDLWTPNNASKIRMAINNALEMMGNNVKDNIDRQTDVEEQFQDVIDETTGKDVISAPEIIAARNGEANLKARLDKEKNETTAQLAQTIQSSVLYLDVLGLSETNDLNDIVTTTFDNVIVNFENKELFLNSALTLTFNNCIIMNLNLKSKDYSTLNIRGHGFKFVHNTLDGSQANKDYFNKADAELPIFRALDIQGDNFELSYNDIKNYVSRQAMYIHDSNNVEVHNNNVIDCYSYNRVSQPQGEFDNYGDGIYFTDIVNGTIKKNRIINSVNNPIGRCGIVVEFNCYKVDVMYNDIKGYDRGIHVELTEDFITVKHNTVKQCNVPMMIWNVQLTHLIVEDNYFSNEGMNYANVLHHTILEYPASSVSLVSVYGLYKSEYKNNSNVEILNNKVINAKGSLYRNYSYVEGAMDVLFEGNEFISLDKDHVSRIMFGSDNAKDRTFYLNFIANVVNGQIDILFSDYIDFRENKVDLIYAYFKDSSNLTVKSRHNRVIKNNVIKSNTGLVMFDGEIDSVIKDNYILNPKGDFIISGRGGGIVEGNVFERTIGVDTLPFTAVKDSGRFSVTKPPNDFYSTQPNLFNDKVDDLTFYLNANNTEHV